MTREEKKKAIDALKISAPVMAVTQEEFNDYIQTLNKVMNWLEQEPSGDLISRVEAIKAIDEKAKRIKNADTLNGLAGAVGILFDLPSVKPQEKTGHWIGIDEEPHEVWECYHCGFVIDSSGCIEPYEYRDTYKFCPNCGAKMQEVEE